MKTSKKKLYSRVIPIHISPVIVSVKSVDEVQRGESGGEYFDTVLSTRARLRDDKASYYSLKAEFEQKAKALIESIYFGVDPNMTELVCFVCVRRKPQPMSALPVGDLVKGKKKR